MFGFVQPIAVQRPAGLQWSVELRRQATATYRERSRAESEVEAGSARCSPLPPKVRTLETPSSSCDYACRSVAVRCIVAGDQELSAGVCFLPLFMVSLPFRSFAHVCVVPFVLL